MKEFIEKLINRLEEQKSKYQDLADSSNFDGWSQEEKIYLAKKDMCDKTIEIVNELAEECQQEPSTIIETVRGNRIDCEIPSDYFEQIKEVRVIDELTEETKVFKEVKNDWIPCSERMPEVEADVLLSLRSLDVYTGFRANTEGCFYVEGEGYVEFENVLAWQPLLEPYQMKGE